MTKQIQTVDDLKEKVRQEFYVNQNHIAGDQALEELVEKAQQEAVRAERERIDKALRQSKKLDQHGRQFISDNDLYRSIWTVEALQKEEK